MNLNGIPLQFHLTNSQLRNTEGLVLKSKRNIQVSAQLWAGLLPGAERERRRGTRVGWEVCARPCLGHGVPWRLRAEDSGD